MTPEDRITATFAAFSVNTKMTFEQLRVACLEDARAAVLEERKECARIALERASFGTLPNPSCCDRNVKRSAAEITTSIHAREPMTPEDYASFVNVNLKSCDCRTDEKTGKFLPKCEGHIAIVNAIRSAERDAEQRGHSAAMEKAAKIVYGQICAGHADKPPELFQTRCERCDRLWAALIEIRPVKLL